MALNTDKIKARLAAVNKKGKTAGTGSSNAKDIIWKPTATHVVRIVPYTKCPDDPFVQLKFHYDFAGDNYLSPASFNKADPIVELADRLKKNKDTWQQGRKLEPKLRTYVPIIVRGEESKGVRWWGFGVQIYNELLGVMSDADYGDITSLTEGFDIAVEFKTALECKKDFPETKIRTKPKARPVVDPTDPRAKEYLEMITTKQPDILSVWTVPTYEVLEVALEEFLKKAASGNKPEADSNVQLPTEKQIADAASNAAAIAVANNPVATEPSTTAAVVSPTAQKAASVPTSAQDLTKAFDNLFNS